jgi:hypothetical protein
VRIEQTVEPDGDGHPAIIGRGRGREDQPDARVLAARGRGLACICPRLIDYALLVVSPACFARAESRSSLISDSLSPPRDC